MLGKSLCKASTAEPMDINTGAGCSYGNCALLARILYCKLGFVKLQIRVLNYNVTGCARLIGIHLGDHRVNVSELPSYMVSI